MTGKKQEGGNGFDPSHHPSLPSHLSRDAIRRQLRACRRALSPWERRHLDRQVARQITRSPLFLRSRHVALYLANDGEVDLTAVVSRARAMGKRVYLPVLSPSVHNRLWFAPFAAQGKLRPNGFGIPEPPCRWRQMRRVWSLDLVLMPLVGFDRRGNRLGMGGGFYDRTLAYLSQRQCWRKPRLLGVAYGCQEWPQLSAAAWDVAMETVVTEAGFVHP